MRQFSTKGNLYLYTSPFLVEDTLPNRNIHISETSRLTEFERTDEQHVREIVFRFAAENDIVEVTNNQFFQSTKQDTGSWVWLINNMNLRSLVDKSQYGKLCSSLQANDEYPITQILSLYTTLGVLFDSRTLNTMSHRTMTSIQAIPYPLNETDESISWDDIYIQTPFVWLIILIQTLINTEAHRVK